MTRNDVLQTAGEILAAQRNSVHVLTKADIAEIIERHLATASREEAHQKALADIERLTIALGKAQRQAQQAERRAAALAERLEACYASFSPAMD